MAISTSSILPASTPCRVQEAQGAGVHVEDEPASTPTVAPYENSQRLPLGHLKQGGQSEISAGQSPK